MKIKSLAKIPLEAWIWTVALTFLSLPQGLHKIELCPSKIIGAKCMGCGLGESVYMVLHGKISESFSAHYLGIFALAVIVLRIIYLIKE